MLYVIIASRVLNEIFYLKNGVYSLINPVMHSNFV